MKEKRPHGAVWTADRMVGNAILEGEERETMFILLRMGYNRKTEAAQSLINAQSPQATSETIAATNASVTENIPQEL